jgi:hypothetical protein
MRFQKDLVMRLRSISLLIATLLLAAPVASASPQDNDECIVGGWTATVYRDDGSVERNAQLLFTSDGKLVTQGAIGEGIGTWESDGGRRFSYTTRTNTSFGYLVVSAKIKLRGDRFVGEGGGTAYDFQGNVLGTGQSVIVAVRAEGAEGQQ